MKILVTGGAGFVGTNLIKRLLKDGHIVISTDNYSTGLKENEQDECDYWDVDLCRNYWPALLGKVDIIYHLAALPRIQPSLEDPGFCIKNNFLSTLNVLEYARKKDIPVIYSGSSSVNYGIYNSPYSWSKHSGEELCALYKIVYGTLISVCRFYNVYGEHQIEDGEYSTVVGVFKKQYENGESLTITGDGKQKRDFTHIDDIVDGLVKMSLIKENKAKVFEFGRGINFTINEIANMFGEHYPKEYIKSRKGEYPETLCNDNFAEKYLGWYPKRNLYDYIKSITNKKAVA